VSALVVVVIVALGESSEVRAQELVVSLTEASPQGTSVILREDVATDDGSVARLASSLHADAVAIVSWSPQGKAQLRVYTAHAGKFRARDLPFSADDAPRERGRATGFVVASMVATTSDEASEAPTETPIVAEPRDTTAPSAAAASLSAGRSPFGLEASIGTALGAAGATTAVGGDAGLGLRLVDHVELRLGGGAYAGALRGDLPSVYARVRAGVSWTFARTPGEKPVTVSARGDGMAILHTATGNGGSGGRWVPGVGASAKVAWEVERHVAPFLQVGAEAALGDTDVFAGDERRATIPFLRVTFGLGVDVRF